MNKNPIYKFMIFFSFLFILNEKLLKNESTKSFLVSKDNISQIIDIFEVSQ